MNAYDKIIDTRIELNALKKQLEEELDTAEEVASIYEKQVELWEKAWDEHPDELTGVALNKAYKVYEEAIKKREMLDDKIASIEFAVNKLNLAIYEIEWIEF